MIIINNKFVNYSKMHGKQQRTSNTCTSIFVHVSHAKTLKVASIRKNSFTQASKCHLLHWACMKLAAGVIQEVEHHMYTLFET